MNSCIINQFDSAKNVFSVCIVYPCITSVSKINHRIAGPARIIVILLSLWAEKACCDPAIMFAEEIVQRLVSIVGIDP